MAGCGVEQANVPGPSLEGITVADLSPTVTPDSDRPPVLLFMVTTYLVDESYLDAVKNCYNSLPHEIIKFANKAAFEANGFSAFYGTGMAMGPVSDCLVRMGADRYGQASLILEAGSEQMFSTAFIENDKVEYISAEGDAKEVSLHNGTLGWAMTAQPDPSAPRRVLTHVEPIFLPHGLRHWPGAEKLAQKMSHRFGAAGFDVSLREADFVLLSVDRDSFAELTPLERLLFIHPGRRNKLRIFAVLCVKVQEH